jgi:hypothetical protein
MSPDTSGLSGLGHSIPLTIVIARSCEVRGKAITSQIDKKSKNAIRKSSVFLFLSKLVFFGSYRFKKSDKLI